MFRNPTDTIYSAPVTCLYGNLNEDREMPLASQQGSHILDWTFSVANILFQQQQQIILPSDDTNFLNNVPEMYISADRKSLFYSFFFLF